MIRRAKLLSPLLIIAVLFSLMSGVLTAAVVTTSQTALASPATTLSVVIEDPSNGDIITPASTFSVTANVTDAEDGEAASNVVVTLALNGYASLPAGDTGVRTFASIGDGLTETVTWSDITCDINGDVIITVTASAFNAPTVSDTITIHQNSLVVYIERPYTSQLIAVGSNFYVNAVITNISPEPMINATAEISIDYPALANIVYGEIANKTIQVVGQDPGVIPGWSAAEVWWELECLAVGDVTITVTAGAEAATGTLLRGSDLVTVHQKDVWLVAEIIEPPFYLADGSIRPPDGYTVCTCNNFVVKAVITNIYNYEISSVTATISIIEGGASLVGDPATWTIGTLGPGDSAEVAWNLHCYEPGYVMITVTPDGYNVGPRVESDSVWVFQAPLEPDLYVMIGSDKDKVCTSDCWNTFTVIGVIANWGCAPATGVTATLEQVGGNGTVSIANATQTVGTVPAFDYTIVTWTVTCTGAGDVDLNATVDGVSSNIITVEQLDDFLVEIIEIARLDGTEQLTFSSEQEFTVTARFTNCLIERSDLKAIIDLSAIGAVLAPGSQVTLEFYNALGELVATENVTAAETIIIDHLCACCFVDITWTLECINSADGTVTVEVWTATGVLLDDDTSDEIVQEWKAHLVSGIGVYRGSLDEGTMETTATGEVDIGETFTVVTKVTNIGEADATDVVVTINVAGPASPSGTMSQTIGEIPGGESAKAIFEFTCTGPGTVIITNPDNAMLALKLEGKDENTGQSIPPDNINVVCAVSVTQVAPPPPAELEVVIIQPETCTVFELDEVFSVKALITNLGGETATAVTAGIYWEDEDGNPYGDAAFVGSQPYVRTIGDISGGATEEVSWVMRCTGHGDVTIWVNATAAEYTAVWSDPVIIHQPPPEPDLHVLVLSPMGYYWGEDYDEYGTYGTFIATSQEFAITAKVYNAGATAEDVEVTLEIPKDPSHHQPYATIVEGANPVFIGDLGYGECEILSWTLHADSTWCPGCAAVGVLFNVTAVADNVPEVVSSADDRDITGEYVGIAYGHQYEYFYVDYPPIVEDSLTVYVNGAPVSVSYVWWDWGEFRLTYQQGVVTADYTQEGMPTVINIYPAAHLVVDIIDYPTEDITVCQDFELSATITNTGQADAWEVKATLSVEPEGSVQVTSGGYTQYIGTLAGWGQDGTAEVTWSLHCKQPCHTTITVTAEGKDECGWQKHWSECYACSGWLWQPSPGHPINDQFIEPDSITVKQLEAASLEVSMSAPQQVGVGQSFDVTAVVSNTGGETATWVDVELMVSGVGVDWATIDSIAGGSSGMAVLSTSWPTAGIFDLAVSASGTYLNTAIASSSLSVVPLDLPEMAQLHLFISYPDSIIVGDEFTVIGVVANIGGGDASDVTMTLDPVGPVSPPPGEELIWDVGDLDAGEHASHTWILHADEVGTVKFILSAEGTDDATLSVVRAITDPEVLPGPPEIQITVPETLDVNVGLLWLIGPILGGFALLSIVIYLVIRAHEKSIAAEIKKAKKEEGEK